MSSELGCHHGHLSMGLTGVEVLIQSWTWKKFVGVNGEAGKAMQSHSGRQSAS